MGRYYSIFEAIGNSDANAVKRFLKQGGDFTRDGGWNPLHEASKIGDISIIKLLIKYDININSAFEIIDEASDYRGTALTEALLNGHIEAAKFLIKNGADVNSSYYSQNQDTPEFFFGEYDLATRSGNCLLLALGYGDEGLIDLMAKSGLKVDTCYDDDHTPLYDAISSSDRDMVDKLLKLDADADQYMEDEDMGKISALIYAVERYSENLKSSSFEIIKLLLKHGASLSSECEGETVIDIVMQKNDCKLDKLFGIQNLRYKIDSYEKNII